MVLMPGSNKVLFVVFTRWITRCSSAIVQVVNSTRQDYEIGYSNFLIFANKSAHMFNFCVCITNKTWSPKDAQMYCKINI